MRTVLLFVDILNDLPIVRHESVAKNNSHASTISESTTTDYESALEQMSSLESLLAGDSSGMHSSPECTSKDETHEEDDNMWMEKFGKGTILRQRSLSTNEIPSNSEHFKFAFHGSRKNSLFTRLETTTYSFSLGGTQHDVDETSGYPNNSPMWVKRDGKERVPVRKLKPVSIKATVSTSQHSSPQSSPTLLKTTPFVLQDIKGTKKDFREILESTKVIMSDSSFYGMDEKDSQPPSLKVNITKLQNLEQNPLSPNASMFSKQAPPVFPKPKKTLDKKSWTADLIKSKTQFLPDVAQPGSLNDKLIKRRDEDPKTEEDDLQRSGSVNKSVKEILTKFESSANRNAKTDGLTERYV